MRKRSFSSFLLCLVFLAATELPAEYLPEYQEYPCYQDYVDGQEYAYEYPCIKKHTHFKGHILTIAPEIYHLKRTRQGGTKQNGTIVGLRASYDHIKRYKIYWGIQAFYGTGIVRGHTGTKSKIRSRWTDEQIEGNLGYTFQYKFFPNYSFTPFGGYGYFKETNNFNPPSPLPLTYVTHFPYISYGFLSKFMLNSNFSIGANLRIKTLWDTRSIVKNDPDFDGKRKLLVGDSWQYRIEVPIVYCQKFLCNSIEFGAMPFYEKRCFGGRENYPFDFFKTTLKLIGIDLQIIYIF